MANTPTREHREAAVEAWRQVVTGSGIERVAQAICDAEQRGYKRGRETERAEAVRYLREESIQGSVRACALVIESGKHLAKDGE